MSDNTRLVPILRKFDIVAGTMKAYYLHDGVPHGTYQQRLCDIPLITSGSSTTVSTDQTKKLPESIGVGAVLYTRTGSTNGIVPAVAGDVALLSKWEERTVTVVTDAFNLVVNEAIDIPTATDGFAYRILAQGDGADDCWIGSGNARQRVLSVQVHSGAPVTVRVEGRNEGGERFLIEEFTCTDNDIKVYEGVADYTRVLIGGAVTANVSASLVNRRF